MENSQVFSTSTNVQFPYTVIDIVSFAKKLLGETGDITIGKTKTQYIFGSSLTVAEGDSMVFIEETLHQVIKLLPSVIEAIQSGKPVKNTQIINLGFPTNTKGYITEQFAHDAEKDPYSAFADVYAEFIHSQKSSGNIEFFGISMGGNFAIRTAEKLMQSGKYSQDQQSGVPKIQIRAESPVSLGTSPIKQFQIPVGFILDSIGALVRDVLQKKNPPNSITTDAKTKMKEIFDKKMPDNMSSEQKSRKLRILWNIVKGLGDFTPDKDTKITRVFGSRDLSLVAPGNKNIQSPGKTYTTKMMHLRPFFDSPSEIRRLLVLLDKIKKIDFTGK
ncbi:MAG: hypothetical protein PHY14_00410 [Candidatus Gracilibacteria bacterium]|nr:hypothetical protein [Candidatus Gracilibacteria bacterium]